MKARGAVVAFALGIAAFVFAVPNDLAGSTTLTTRMPVGPGVLAERVTQVETFGFPVPAIEHRASTITGYEAVPSSATRTVWVGGRQMTAPRPPVKGRTVALSREQEAKLDQPAFSVDGKGLGWNALAVGAILALTALWRWRVRRWSTKRRRALTVLSILLLSIWPFVLGVFLFLPFDRDFSRWNNPLLIRSPLAILGTIAFTSVLLVVVLVRDRLSPAPEA